MASPSVCILDYGSGNVGSVYNLVSSLCPNTIISNTSEEIEKASHLILPGVGAFGAAMEKIHRLLPLKNIEASIHTGKPFLGICVGMQVLATTGEEFGTHKGLGWIPGSVKKLDVGKLPLPHIGWNNLEIMKPHSLLEEVERMPDFYFVHSYAFYPDDGGVSYAKTSYGETFCAVIAKDNILGVQFHPEKSQRAGVTLMKNFLRMV